MQNEQWIMNNIHHLALGEMPFARLRALAGLVRSGAVNFGGNGPGRIYGRLDCRAGKRMNPRNRVFFRDETEALAQGFRPCAVCLPEKYKAWKQKSAS